MREEKEPVGQDHKLVVVNESAAVSVEPDSHAAAEADLHKALPAVGDALEPERESPRSPI